jgi:hypothetical protein
MNPSPNRLDALLDNPNLTGIDFVYVYPSQVQLDVYFLWDADRHNPPVPMPLLGGLAAADVRIYDPAAEAAAVPVAQLVWAVVDGRDVARLLLPIPGDFTHYRIQIADARIDPYYNDVPFSFKANCPSDLDCAPPEPDCPPAEVVDASIDYLARDFGSFRRALLDFAHLRYPHWPDRLEADVGVMLAEVMSAVGDEMAYYQDRIAREAYLETATQRRSVRRHTRLVDYTLHEGRAATTWLDVTVALGAGSLPTGAGVWAIGDGGTRIDFEVGRGLHDPNAGYTVAVARNQFAPHIWDEDDLCLPVGATYLHVQGHQAANLVFDDVPPGVPPGKWVLLQTQPTNAAQPIRTQLVRLIGVTDEQDPVQNVPITRLEWATEQVLTHEFDLTSLVVRGNLVPVTAGRQRTHYFLVGQRVDQLTPPQQTALQLAVLADRATLDQAVERQGHDGTLTYLMTLPEADKQALVWLGPDLRRTRPDLRLTELDWIGGVWQPDRDWQWRQSLLGTDSAQADSTDFTLDDGSWRRVVGYRHGGNEFIHRDYASDAGKTIRFGDGEFGLIPARNTLFRATYRLGGGRVGNVGPGSLRGFDESRLPPGLTLAAVTNALPATDGEDTETLTEVRQLAPDAFRVLTYRAVRPDDYAEAAERLPWVQRAGASFRHTGSWLSAFTTPDPRGLPTLPTDLRRELTTHLDRFRMAGREAHVSEPVYANIDLLIEVCADVRTYPGELKERLLTALLGRPGYDTGYFGPDRFTFGTPLDRSTLEAAIQRVPGVRAVEGIRFRRRGWFDWRPFTDYAYDPGRNAIIRVANDPLHPDRGSLNLSIHGGA